MKGVAKRAFDIVGSTIGITIFGIPCILAATALTMLNRESPIYLQKRVGLNGKEFTLIKLKTAPHKYNEHGDILPLEERITKVGNWLRTVKVDELPNFINVLKGDMSLVGPRPLINPNRHYGDAISLDKKRVSVRPGMTGLAQIKNLNELTDIEILEYDHKYIDEQTLWGDFIICAKTIPSVIKNRKTKQHGEDRIKTYNPSNHL
ncbi:MAG: sugar transferase [Alphaproteobacteria bacterium]|nr:sugar transferase [Alphaproteobacteria bacterium]